MNEADIRKYAELMRELELTGLEITEGDRVVRLERSAPETVQVPVVPAAPAAPAAAAAPAAPEAEEGDLVRAPLVGTFYVAPAPGEPPFAAPGKQVKKGETLCLIEAMKMMSEVPAPADCVVEEVLAADGEPVGYHDPLFRIRKV